MVASASIIVVALLMAPVHDSSQFVGSHAPAEHVARCALMTAARIGAALESVLELGSAVEQRNPVGVRVVSVCRRVSVSGLTTSDRTSHMAWAKPKGHGHHGLGVRSSQSQVMTMPA